MAHFIIGLSRDSAAASTLDAFKSPPFDALVPVPTRFVLRYSRRVFRWRPFPSKREDRNWNVSRATIFYSTAIVGSRSTSKLSSFSRYEHTFFKFFPFFLSFTYGKLTRAVTIIYLYLSVVIFNSRWYYRFRFFDNSPFGLSCANALWKCSSTSDAASPR